MSAPARDARGAELRQPLAIGVAGDDACAGRGGRDRQRLAPGTGAQVDDQPAGAAQASAISWLPSSWTSTWPASYSMRIVDARVGGQAQAPRAEPRRLRIERRRHDVTRRPRHVDAQVERRAAEQGRPLVGRDVRRQFVRRSTPEGRLATRHRSLGTAQRRAVRGVVEGDVRIVRRPGRASPRGRWRGARPSGGSRDRPVRAPRGGPSTRHSGAS